MKIICRILVFPVFLLVLGVFPGAARGQVQEGSQPDLSTYHPAASEVEKILDRVVRLSEKDANLVAFVLHTPWYRPKADTWYIGSFTKRFLSGMAGMERKAVKENCKGTYLKDEVCGLDYNPLTCSQDQADTPYLYHTESLNNAKAVISYIWPGETQRAAVFEMLYENGAWKIDAVRCQPDVAPAK